MRLANLAGRACIVTKSGLVDVASASNGRLPHDLPTLYDQWNKFVDAEVDLSLAAPFDPAELGPPSPAPRQVFAIGLNYAAHAAESGRPLPAIPATFTKFPSCLTGPYAPVTLPSNQVDYEVEIVVVIGTKASGVSASQAWNHVAGLTVGQDYSDRGVQYAAGAQFSLGKSYFGFGPTGPWLVTPDAFANRDDLELSCYVNGEKRQLARSSGLIFSIPMLIQRLSEVTPLLPGDLVFTGTPEGVGASRQPPLFLQSGDVVESTIEGIGSIRNVMRTDQR